MVADSWSKLSEYAVGFDGFNNSEGLAVDAVGNVYAADKYNNRIQKLNVSKNTWVQWGKDGGASDSSLGEFNTPYGVAVDSTGNIYAADTCNNRIQKLNISTNTWSIIGSGRGSASGQFNDPYGIAVDSHGNVYIADSDNNRIQKLDVSTNTWSF